MGLYKQAKSDNWYVRFEYGGREYRRTTGTSNRREAERRARRIRAEVEATTPAPRLRRLTLADLMQMDLERALARGTGEQQQQSIKACWAHLFKAFGEDGDPCMVTFDIFEKYIALRRSQGARGQSIRKERQALHRGLKIAKRRGKLDQVLEDWPEIRSDPPRESQAGSLHPPDVVNRWLEELPHAAWCQASLAIYTGLRREELRKLTMRWVEPAPSGSAVPAYLRPPAKSTKTKRERVIGLVPEALAIIEALAAEKGPDAPLCPAVHNRAYQGASKRIGYHKTITLRDLRHCHATWATHTGDVRAVQAALGHTDLRTTQRYLHSTAERAAGAAVAATAHLTRHTRVGIPDSGASERASGWRDSNSRLPAPEAIAGWIDELLDCAECRPVLLALIEAHPIEPDTRHTGSAYPAYPEDEQGAA